MTCAGSCEIQTAATPLAATSLSSASAAAASHPEVGSSSKSTCKWAAVFKWYIWRSVGGIHISYRVSYTV